MGYYYYSWGCAVSLHSEGPRTSSIPYIAHTHRHISGAQKHQVPSDLLSSPREWERYSSRSSLGGALASSSSK